MMFYMASEDLHSVDYLFGQKVDLESRNTLRNLSEIQASKTVFDTFKKAINALTVVDKGSAEIRDYIKLKQVRPLYGQRPGILCAEKKRV